MGDIGAKLSGRRIAVLVANEGVEQVELIEPWEAVRRAGGTPVLLAPSTGTVQAFDHLDRADTFRVNRSVAEARPEDFDGLVLPGGVANPDQLRTCREAVDFVRNTVRHGRPVAVICHGPWTLVEANVVRGRTLTSWPSLATDIRNAGGTWVDEPVVVCEDGPTTFVSSRRPDDLPRFCDALVDAFAARPALVGSAGGAR
jgi:protease I